MSRMSVNIQYSSYNSKTKISASNITYNRKGNTTYTVLLFSPKEANHILSNLHFTNSVIFMSRTVDILLLMRYMLGYVAAGLTGTDSVQKAPAQL